MWVWEHLLTINQGGSVAKVRTGVEESRSRLKIHIGPATLVLNTFQRMIEKYFLEVLEAEDFVEIL